jgi:beta-lactamase class A
MQGKRPAADIFTDRFLAEVPADKLVALARKLEMANGKILGIENVSTENGGTAAFGIRFERATATARLTIETAAPYRVGGFWIGSVVPTNDTMEKIAADFAALPGRAGFTVTKLDGTPPVAAGHADEQFAIGSTFKLWVLDALAEEIAAGRRHWDEVVPLGPKSLPSGITQDWPAGTPATIETLAILMISRSDNTATDTLIHLIGRERIGERVRATGHSDPARALPFPTTADLFALKLGPAATREAYAKADETGQAQMLDALDPQKIIAGADSSALAGKPTAIDTIEWFASPADIARILDSLRRRSDQRVLQVLAVAPDLPADQRSRFGYVGYKGGSEPGVLNLSWLLRTKAGEWIVITASWNDPENSLDPGPLQQLAMRLVALIH